MTKIRIRVILGRKQEIDTALRKEMENKDLVIRKITVIRETETVA